LKCAGLPSSTYYYVRKHAEVRKNKDKDLVQTIGEIQAACNGKYGSRTMTTVLGRIGPDIYGRRSMARIMWEYGLHSKVRRRKHPKGYYRKKKRGMENLPGNLLDRNFTAERPLQKLVTDVTYLPIKSGWCYFGLVMDLFNREIVAYVLFLSVRLDLSQWLLAKLEASDLNPDAMVHSVRGSIYTAIAYRDRLKHMGIVQSMSRAGNCWENACMYGELLQLHAGNQEKRQDGTDGICEDEKDNRRLGRTIPYAPILRKFSCLYSDSPFFKVIPGTCLDSRL
jgi:hypothetical protein